MIKLHRKLNHKQFGKADGCWDVTNSHDALENEGFIKIILKDLIKEPVPTNGCEERGCFLFQSAAVCAFKWKLPKSDSKINITHITLTTLFNPMLKMLI